MTHQDGRANLSNRAAWAGAKCIGLAAALALGASLGGCGDWRLFAARSSGDLRAVSELQKVQYAPTWRTAVYRSADSQSAEIYLTDLPLDRLSDLDDPLTDLTGSIVQVSLFMQPRAGRTPIDDSACNAAFRQLVISGPARGVYGGGGFVIPQGLGSAQLRGSVDGATLRLIRMNEGFVDPIGPGEMVGTFRARFDAELSRLMAQRMQSLAGGLKDVAPANAAK
jgi:hypothetical protein